ncbi:O-antigen ligase family protein [Microbacterium sp. GXF6406]
MAQYTKHPVQAPPTAPERESTGRLLLRAYVIIAFIAVLAHDALLSLFGGLASGAALLVTTLAGAAIAAPMIARQTPHAFPWRRLPWAALAYPVFAAASDLWSGSATDSLVMTVVLLATAGMSLLIGFALTWDEIIRSLASALKWILGLALAAEAWARLFHDDRFLQFGGNPALLAGLSALAIVVFGIQFARRSRWRTTTALWGVLAAVLLFSASSATAYLGAAAGTVVLVFALTIRRTSALAARRRVYAVGGILIALLSAATAILHRALLAALGEAGDAPDPANIMDASAQVGVVGALVLCLAVVSLLWRAWFFAADRPRWDLRADRPYSSLTLLPLLCIVIATVQALAGSSSAVLWGWMLLVLCSFKIKAVPLVGVGLREQARVTERGRRARRIP